MLNLRPATPADAPAYFDHMQRHFRESGEESDVIFHPVTDFKDWKKEEHVAKTVADLELPIDKVGWQRIWIAEDEDGNILADCLLRSGFMESTAHRCQFAIGVEREARGQGLGGRISMLALTWAKQQPSLDWIDLWVFDHNKAAIALYEKLGFRKIDTVRDQFRVKGQKIDDTHMCLSLKGQR